LLKSHFGLEKAPEPNKNYWYSDNQQKKDRKLCSDSHKLTTKLSSDKMPLNPLLPLGRPFFVAISTPLTQLKM